MNKLEGASAFKREVSSIPISKIKTNPYQPRKFFSENAIKELARSIREVGLLQPITLRSTASGYELVAGERRLRACKMLGMKEISAIVVPNMRECESGFIGDDRKFTARRFAFSRGSRGLSIIDEAAWFDSGGIGTQIV